MADDLRDLAEKIRAVAQAHPSYSQAHRIVSNCVDHLCTLAAYNEQATRAAMLQQKGDSSNARINELERECEWLKTVGRL